jgi:hypothetical protein
VITGGGKFQRILGTVKRIGEKHATKEHDFGSQKNPHAKRSRLALLLQILEVVLQRRVTGSVVRCDVALSQSDSLSLFA